MNMKTRITSEHEYGAKTVKLYYTEQLDMIGGMAWELIARWGMVAAKPGTEDSAGRNVAELQTPEELVNRAFVTTQLFWDRARAFNHVVKLPDLNEVNEEYDAKQAKKRLTEDA